MTPGPRRRRRSSGALAWAGWLGAAWLGAAAGTLPAFAAPNPVDWIRAAGVPGLDGRLRILTVDPEDPRRIYAGTKEGTLLFSHDGGETWQERPLSPFVVDERRRALPRAGALADGLVPRAGNQSIRRIAVCSAAPYPLLVLTQSALYGSQDGGVSFVRLLGVFEQENLRTVHCAPGCSAHVAVAGERGLYLSSTGGVAFDSRLTPPGTSVDVAELACEKEGPPTVWVSQSRRLYSLDLAEANPSFIARYPGPPEPGALPAPSAPINDIEVDGATVWLATELGVQRSRDGGATWAALPNDLGRFVRQVWLRPRSGGGRDVAIVLDLTAEARTPGSSLNAIALVSSDDGASWSPLFAGLSQRRVRWLGHGEGGRWWLATSGGIWTDEPLFAGQPPVLVEWAIARLEAPLSLGSLIDAALLQARLTDRDLAGLAGAFRARCLLPVLSAAALSRRSTLGLGARLGPIPFSLLDDVTGRDQVRFLATARWDLDCAVGDGARAGRVRPELQVVRDRLTYAVQDAYHERQVFLEQLVRGAPARQAFVLRARVEAMEGVLTALTGARFSRGGSPRDLTD